MFGVASPTKFTNVVLREGDELRYRTPGGAGFGPPAERDLDAVRADLVDGYISAAEAERAYGVALEAEGASG